VSNFDNSYDAVIIGAGLGGLGAALTLALRNKRILLLEQHICGPQAMYNFLDKEIDELNIPKRRIRREVFGQPDDITLNPKFPKNAIGKIFEIKVKVGNRVKIIKSSSTESVLVLK